MLAEGTVSVLQFTADGAVFLLIVERVLSYIRRSRHLKNGNGLPSEVRAHIMDARDHHRLIEKAITDDPPRQQTDLLRGIYREVKGLREDLKETTKEILKKIT